MKYVVFRPEQIKSATGNAGTFGPASANIRFSRADLAPDLLSMLEDWKDMAKKPLALPIFEGTLGMGAMRTISR